MTDLNNLTFAQVRARIEQIIMTEEEKQDTIQTNQWMEDYWTNNPIIDIEGFKRGLP